MMQLSNQITKELRLVFEILEWWKNNKCCIIPNFVTLAEQIAKDNDLISCKNCLANGNQNKFPSRCTGCGVDEFKNFLIKD